MVVRTNQIVNPHEASRNYEDSLALFQFSRIKLVNIKKINQNNMVNNLAVHTYVGPSSESETGQ